MKKKYDNLKQHPFVLFEKDWHKVKKFLFLGSLAINLPPKAYND